MWELFSGKMQRKQSGGEFFHSHQVLLVQPMSQIFTTFLICQVFLTRKRFLPGPLQNKSIKKQMRRFEEEGLFASELLRRKTEWNFAQPGGLFFWVLCNNFSRSSRFSAFVKFLCKRFASFFISLPNVYSFSYFLYESSSSRTSVREAKLMRQTRWPDFPCPEVGYWA